MQGRLGGAACVLQTDRGVCEPDRAAQVGLRPGLQRLQEVRDRRGAAGGAPRGARQGGGRRQRDREQHGARPQPRGRHHGEAGGGGEAGPGAAEDCRAGAADQADQATRGRASVHD